MALICLSHYVYNNNIRMLAKKPVSIFVYKAKKFCNNWK